jgi:signal transduction histidine kinase
MYLTYLLLLGLAILGNTIVLVIFYLHTQKNFTTLSLFTLLSLVNIWFLPKFFTNLLHLSGWQFETASRIAAFGYIFVPVTLVLFCLSYAGYYKVFQKLSFWLSLFVPPLVFLYLSWTSDLVGVHTYATAKLYAWGYETPTGKLWPWYSVWYDLLIVCSLGILGYYYHTMLDQTKKKQTRYFIIAIIAPLLINAFTVEILPMFNIFTFPIGLLLIDLVMVIGISLIYRYGWFEVTPMIILSSLNHIILTVDKKGRIIQLNPFAEKKLKVQATELLGRPVDSLLFIHDTARKQNNHILPLLKQVLRRGTSMTFDSFAVSLHNKQKLTNMISISPLTSSGIVVGANIFLHDTKKDAVREKQKDDYFSMVFHEIKSPITSIKAYNQLLLAKSMEKGNEEQQLLVLKIDKQLERLTRLVNDFMELSRLHAGKVKLKKEYFDVNTFIAGIVETIRVTYTKRNFRIEGSVTKVVYGDKDKIEQIVINLITNAIKFSPQDTDIVIHLASDNKKVTIGVQDYGRGIDPKFHKRIFDRFFQASTGASGKLGLGIGLFIASTIVKAHDGKIWVESTLKKGSTFYFSLPLNGK